MGESNGFLVSAKQIKELKQLTDQGVLTVEEFEEKKARILDLPSQATHDDKVNVEEKTSCDAKELERNEPVVPALETSKPEFPIKASSGSPAFIVGKSSTSARRADTDPAELLTRYKKLFDDGILTQEEFERQKRVLLGIADEEIKREKARNRADAFLKIKVNVILLLQYIVIMLGFIVAAFFLTYIASYTPLEYTPFMVVIPAAVLAIAVWLIVFVTKKARSQES